MSADLSRYADWLSWLTQHAEADLDVVAVWIGGSAVTGGYDDWSDLDITVLSRETTFAAVYARLLAGARADFAIADVWEVPEATWPNGRQCFLNPQERPGLLLEPTLLLDVCVLDVSEERRHVDVRRHGTPLVLHDPGHLVALRPDDPVALDAAIATGLDQVRQRRVTGEWLVNRSIRRGHDAEALDLYLRFALGPLVRLLRTEHCPWRHDFGLRYLHEDLPADVADRVDSLVPGRGELAELSAACFAWQDDLLAHHPSVPGSPLNGPTTPEVIQPP